MKIPTLKLLSLTCLLFGSWACHNNANNQQNDIAEFENVVKVKTDTISVNPERDTIVFGKEGVGVFFEKHSLVFADGSEPKGLININLKECLKISDIVREHLSTASDTQLLETKGMIYVGATADGKELQLKSGKKFIIHFPKDTLERKKRMCLFYGKQDSEKNINWDLDKSTLLKPTAYMEGWRCTGSPFDDSTKSGFFFKGAKQDSIFEYFYKHFDYTKLGDTKNMLYRLYSVNFAVSTQGKIKNVKIEELDSAYKPKKSNLPPDPYFVQYINGFPDLEPFYNPYTKERIESDCSFYIRTDMFPPDYLKNDAYNKLFTQKYSMFRDKKIQSMNDAELRYYIFSSTKLGWINCDYFWQNSDEKINYIVKIDPSTNTNVVMVFKKDKVIIYGRVEADKCFFTNVPLNHDVRIIAIKFKDSKPLMSITDSKISKDIYDKSDYKEFTLAELQKQLDGDYSPGD